jgi:Asp-tRNA(Asn)/Glu-tRNA(Gln) amidotransferase A subunit family amidase
LRAARPGGTIAPIGNDQETTMSTPHAFDRRAFMAYCSGLGLGATLFPGALWVRLQDAKAITKDLLDEAEKVAGLEFTEAERDLMLEDLNDNLEGYQRLRAIGIGNEVRPALSFDPGVPESALPRDRRPLVASRPANVRRPATLEALAFRPVTELAELVRTRQVTAAELTRMYLARLKRHGPALECVIALTEERALRQAADADREIAAGRYRGPLHGIPWGAKDLLAVRDYPTTWGAKPFETQRIDEDATVVQRLDAAGAVLVAKLTLGALAWGDVWFGGTTKNPWNLEQGSSGSSAGPASATVAGLVAFSIGSETLGSIVSPSTRCGATGLRPTFGWVSRAGAMALSWSMDKLGPIGRTVEDCALVMAAIHGPDGRDPTVRDAAFAWDGTAGIGGIRVGYLASAFERERGDNGAEWRAFDLRALDTMRRLVPDLTPVELPDRDTYPPDAMGFILSVEAAAAFDELTRSNRDDLMVRQVRNAWPNVFRAARLVPAVEYINANRLRTMLMRAMDDALANVDVVITPSYAPRVLQYTNLTGHPAVVLPNGFRAEDGTPTSISFIGRLFTDAKVLAVAKAWQEATDFHTKHPARFA